MNNIFRKKELPNYNGEVVLNKQTPFTVSEAYKSIRSNLSFVFPDSSHKVFAISSANPSEGKSTTSVNTAIAFSQLNRKVLLIDADLRKPTICKVLKLSNAVGLSGVLAKICSLNDAVQKIDTNLHVLGSGQIPPNPSELLSSANMDELLAVLTKHYDYIIIDTPPINLVSDFAAIATKTDGIVIVVKANQTRHDEFKKAVTKVKLSHSKILGVVINGVEETGKYYSY